MIKFFRLLKNPFFQSSLKDAEHSHLLICIEKSIDSDHPLDFLQLSVLEKNCIRTIAFFLWTIQFLRGR